MTVIIPGIDAQNQRISIQPQNVSELMLRISGSAGGPALHPKGGGGRWVAEGHMRSREDFIKLACLRKERLGTQNSESGGKKPIGGGSATPPTLPSRNRSRY